MAIGALLVSCEQPEPASAKPDCNVNAFRACQLDACRGAQQCLPPGFWSPCDCTITDATFPEPEAAAEAGADGSDGS